MLFYGLSGLGDLSPCNNSNIFDSTADCSAGCLDDSGNPTSWGAYSGGTCLGAQATGNACANGNVFDATADCSAICVDNHGTTTTWGAFSGGMCRGSMTAPSASAGSSPGSPGRTGAPSNPGAQPQGSGTPWWATLTSALSQGVTSGIVQKPGVAVVAAPWYSSPLALGGIAIGVIALIFILKK